MTNEEKIKAILESFVKGMVHVQVQAAKVIAVNMNEETCDVKFLDEDLANHNGVHLTAGIDIKSGLILEPEIDSVVYVGIVANDPQWAYVTLFTKLASVKLRGDQYGGMVKVAENVKKLNKLEKDLNDLKTAFKTWIVATGDGGTALKAITSTWSNTNIELTEVSQLENTEVKHG